MCSFRVFRVFRGSTPIEWLWLSGHQRSSAVSTELSRLRLASKSAPVDASERFDKDVLELHGIVVTRETEKSSQAILPRMRPLSHHGVHVNGTDVCIQDHDAVQLHLDP